MFHACISRLGERGYWGRKNGWQPNDPLVKAKQKIIESKLKAVYSYSYSNALKISVHAESYAQSNTQVEQYRETMLQSDNTSIMYNHVF